MELGKLYLTLIVYLVKSAHSLPWGKTDPNVPICTSYGGLCDIKFDIISKGNRARATSMNSDTPMCECPNKANPCPSDSNPDPRRTITKDLASADHSVTVSLSYCDALSIPDRPCGWGESVMTVVGMGPILYQIVGDIKCNCSTTLFLHSARPSGYMSQQEYVCGKDICDVNRSEAPVCERVTSKRPFGLSVSSEIPCVCPSGYRCSIGRSKGGFYGFNSGSSDFTCRPRRT